MNRNMRPIRNLFTHKILMVKLAVKELRSAKFYAILLVSVMLAGIFSLSPAISLLMNDVIIRSTGRIASTNVVTANSGSARDIQAAVDEVVAAGGIGSVYIPEGTFNFVEIGEPWQTVNIPAGVNIFGAPTERTSRLPIPPRGMNPNDQVIEWKTILVMPYEAPHLDEWFYVQGSGDPNVGFRFSDIKLIGWRYFDSSSTTGYYGIFIDEVQNFRVDHCHFQDMAESAIWAGDAGGTGSHTYTRAKINGVIDHCRLVNTLGDIGMVYENRDLGYGVGLRRWACDLWDDLEDVIGKYTDHTVFIEDSYFSKWRHGVCSNDGFHYVFRHNIVEGDYGQRGSIDSHGSRADADHPLAVGTRAVEVYDNVFKDPDPLYATPYALNHRGGSGIIFNNTLQNYDALLHLDDGYDWGNELLEYCRIWDTYIWDNDLGGGALISYIRGWAQEDVSYFLRSPSLAEDGWEYTPYVYPHPLTLESYP